jgi:spore germination protein GerM
VIRTGLGGKIIMVLIAFVAILLIIFYLIPKLMELGEEAVPPEVRRVSEETRSVTLYFVNEDADRLLTETREIPAEGGLEAQLRGVIGELIEGPADDDKFSPFPEGADVLQAFWVEETQTAYLDFSRTLITNHHGGSTTEYYTISTVLKTIAANFPQVRLVQFLVDGYPVETIAGHYAVDEPLDVLRWR